MTSTGFKSPWQGVWSLDEIVNRRIRRPRTTGVTMVIDMVVGTNAQIIHSDMRVGLVRYLR